MNHRFGRTTIKQYFLYSLLILGAAAIVVMYLMGGNEIFESKKEDVTYREANEVVLPMHAVKTLCPAASTDEDTYYIAPLVYDSLFQLDDSMTPVPNLAASYTFDSSHMSITINLIDTTWQDGTALTAQDVLFTIEAYKRAGENCNYYDKIRNIGYTEGSDKQVTIYFDTDANLALDMLTFPILPAHKFSYYGDATDAGENFIPMGTGPYKVKAYDPATRLTLVPNETYHGEVPQNTLYFDTQAMKGDLYQLLQAGGVSMMISKDEDRATNITKKDVEIVDFPANVVEFVGFNCKKGASQEKLIRQAVCYAIDNRAVIDREHYGSGIINDGLFFPGYMGIDSSTDTYAFDTKKAEETLRRAGYTSTDDNGNIVDGEGNNLLMTILVNSEDAGKVGAAEILQTELEDLGILVTVTEMEGNAYYSALAGGNFDIYFGTYTFDDRMDMRALFGYEKTNYAGYSNDEVATLLRSLREGQTIEQMRTTVEKIRSITLEDVPYYCLFYHTYGAVTTSTFEGEPTPIWNNYYYHSGNWKSRYKVVEEESETDADADTDSATDADADAGTDEDADADADSDTDADTDE